MPHSDGCHVRVQQTLDLLRRCGAQVTFYSYRNNEGWPWSETHEKAFAVAYPNWRLVLEEDSFTRKQIARLKSMMVALAPARSEWIVRRAISGLTPRLDELCAKEKFDYIFLNNAAGFSEVNGIEADKIIVDMHDFSALELLRGAAPASLRGLWTLRKELAYLSRADLIWCISFAEHMVIKELLEGKAVRFVPATAQLVGEFPSPNCNGYHLLFVGSANRWNADALLRFLDEYETWRTPRRVAVAGRVCEDPRVRSRAASLREVELLGFQSDIGAIYSKAAASICPVEGTGTKIKIIESLAAGRPVFAAPGATRGMAPGYAECVFPLDENSIAKVFSSAQSLVAASTAALSYNAANGVQMIHRTIAPDFQ